MESTHKAIIRTLMVIMAFGLYSLGVAAAEKQPVESSFEKFEQSPSVETASRFMDALLAEKYLDEPVRFNQKMSADSLRQQVYYWAGDWLYNQQRYDEARRVAMKALPSFHGNNENKADCLSLLSLTNMRLGDFTTAAHYAQECLKMDLMSGDDDLISSSMNTVAGIYMAANQPREAEKYVLGALEHSARVDNKPRRAVILGMASEVYHKLGDDRKALSYAEQAYRIDSLLKREPQASIRLAQKGYALIGLQRYKEAESIFVKVLPTLKSAGDDHSYAIALNNMGRALLYQKRQREAISYFKVGAAIFSRMGDTYNEVHSHRGLYESYWEINPDSAKIELDRFNMLKDSLYTHSTAESLSRYNAEFGNMQLQLENSEMRQNHQRVITVGLFLLLLLVLASLLIIRQIHISQQNKMQKLMAEIEKLRAEASVQPKPEPSSQTEASEAEPQDTGKERDREFLKSVIDAVNEAMATGNTSVEQIASVLNMGEQSFRRRLQSAAGETPKAFFTAIRMERASSLLVENPDMPVSRVAELCGFENVSSFGHAFKRTYDCSPSQFRSRAGGEKIAAV